jgi:hypothetical protein
VGSDSQLPKLVKHLGVADQKPVALNRSLGFLHL